MKERAFETDYKRNRGETRELDGEEFFEHFTLVANAGQKTMRVDKFLATFLPNISRSRIQNASKAGSILVNGSPVRVSYKIKPRDEVKLILPYPPPPEMEPEEIPLDIRHEDEQVIVLYKSANMVCHPGIGNHHGTLVQGLLWHVGLRGELPKGTNDHSRASLAHRLDKNTTGIMVVAKTEAALAHLGKQFFNRTTHRLYHAIVWGDVAEDAGTIEAHTGRNIRNRKIFAAFPDGSQGKHAITHFKVLERFGIATLVQLKLETGRTHQIRVHMKYKGHPLIGDHEYGGDQIPTKITTGRFKQFAKNCLTIMPHQALHAKTLAFDHPANDERMTFDSEPSSNFIELLEKLRIWYEAYNESE
ncbi:MAG: RluA family pseudouridine synthase [Bacteroidia bacterium]